MTVLTYQNSRQTTRYTATIAAEKTLWDAHLAPANSVASNNAFEPGAEIFESTSGLILRAYKSSASPFDTFFYAAGGGTLSIGVAGVGGTTKNRLVKMSGANTYVAISAQGERASGIVLNTALPGQAVYVLRTGQYLVENGGVAVTAGGPVTVTANGRSENAAALDFVFGEAIQPGIVIGGTTFDLCSVGLIEVI